MASLSGVNPLSLGEYNGVGTAGGVGAGVTGATGLAQAMIGDPARQAQAGYYGAETGRAQAQTSQINDQLLAGRQAATDFAQGIVKADNGDPSQLMQALSYAARSPDVAMAIPKMIQTLYAVKARGGAGGAPAPGSVITPGQADALAASLPNGTSYQNTQTGDTAGLTNQRAVATIGAGATLGAARISADASMTNNRATNDTSIINTNSGLRSAESQNTTNVGDGIGPDGAPRTKTMTKTEAGLTHAPGYDSPVANTIAGAATAPVLVQGANGPISVTTHTAQENQYQPLPATSDQQTAQTTARIAAAKPDANVPVPASLANTIAGAPNAAGTPAPTTPGPTVGNSGTQGASNKQVGDASGAAPQAPVGAEQVGERDVLIRERLQALRPGGLFSGGNDPAPGLMDPIRLEVEHIMQTDPRYRSNLQAAVTLAVQNVAGAKGENLDFDSNFFGFDGRRSSQIILKPGPKPDLTPASGGLGAAIAGPKPSPGSRFNAAPSAPPAPPVAPPAGVPQQPAQGAPPARAPQATGTGPNGEKWAVVNGTWVRQ